MSPGIGDRCFGRGQGLCWRVSWVHSWLQAWRALYMVQAMYKLPDIAAAWQQALCSMGSKLCASQLASTRAYACCAQQGPAFQPAALADLLAVLQCFSCTVLQIWSAFNCSPSHPQYVDGTRLSLDKAQAIPVPGV